MSRNETPSNPTARDAHGSAWMDTQTVGWLQRGVVVHLKECWSMSRKANENGAGAEPGSREQRERTDGPRGPSGHRPPARRPPAGEVR